MNIHKELLRYGAVLVRGLIDPAAAVEIDRRFRLNLERLTSVFPNYTEDANRHVFPISVAMADCSEPTLPDRLEQAAKANILDPRYITEEETSALREFVYPVLSLFSGYQLAGLDNCYARFDKARPNSPYKSQAIHQDAAFQLMGLTAWIALTQCGRNAPALQFIRRKRNTMIPTEPGLPFIKRSRFWFYQWTRPVYMPGDVVIFDAFTVHGTYIKPQMTSARTSLDVRFKLKH